MALLAMLLQLAAPVRAAWAMGTDWTASDVPVCAQHAAAPVDHAPAHHTGLDCAACQACCHSQVVAPPGSLGVPAGRVVARPVLFDRWQPASPRGPPAARPRARSPPCVS